MTLELSKLAREYIIAAEVRGSRQVAIDATDDMTRHVIDNLSSYQEFLYQIVHSACQQCVGQQMHGRNNNPPSNRERPSPRPLPQGRNKAQTKQFYKQRVDQLARYEFEKRWHWIVYGKTAMKDADKALLEEAADFNIKSNTTGLINGFWCRNVGLLLPKYKIKVHKVLTMEQVYNSFMSASREVTSSLGTAQFRDAAE